MKSLHYIFILGTAAMLSLASCELKNELTGSLVDKEDTGSIELGVSVKQPVSQTRADVSGIDTNTYPVVIQGISDGVTDIKHEYETLAEMPASITVPVGQYTLSSHTPGTLEKQMTTPYYAGSTDITVSKDIASKADVVCRMANSRIQMNYGEDFKEAFSQWTITINDGSEMALSYTQENLTPAPIYWHFDDNVTTITVNIRATTTAGNTVSESRNFRKKDATENYEEVGEAFTGGDALEINMGTVTSSTGNLEGITINTNITFEDSSEAVEIPTHNPNPDPPVPGETISITEPEGNNYLTNGVDLAYGTTDYPESPVVINMSVQNGIQNMFVKVNTTNSTFEMAAGLMGLTSGNGLDLASDDAADLGSLFALPQINDTIYSFTLNDALLSLLMNGPGYVGEHKFTLTVIDKNNQQKSAILTIRVNE
ncbi:MAG TPA: DUF4493 domain-containing protein [Mediterranea massiliensis]|uniref:DUF4493 domain-containing protein n=1 Tax=Mediterranea massiliensis TaxID=1841865 RepID=A0A921HZG6_9BACT|nr:DUF4493 domain-containing protein [Mediterranea massiliensis]HJF92661.1 DUF4493 domain-containing protein [Mediterranea massiliensis]